VLLCKSYGFAGALSQVVQFCTFCFAAAERPDVEDIGTIQREDALDAFVVDDSANGEHLVYTTAPAGNDGAGEDLHTLLAAFDNSAVYVNCVADFEMRDFVLETLAFDRI